MSDPSKETTRRQQIPSRATANQSPESPGEASFSAVDFALGNVRGQHELFKRIVGIEKAPEYSLTHNDDSLDIQDSPMGLYSDSNEIETASKVKAYNPVFNKNTMRDTLPETHFKGENSKSLGEAMIILYSEPEGDELDSALLVIGEARGLDLSLDQLRAQYHKAMGIKKAGQERLMEQMRQEGKSDEEIEAELETSRFSEEDVAEGGKHYGFTGSTGQLRFGMIMGDVFGLDPVFGSLLSPTGGGVGPGRESISGADPNNSAVLHGTVHDAAGYLLNHHGIGTGYNYLQDPSEIFSSDNPLSGQVSGTAYFADRGQYYNLAATIGTVLTKYDWDKPFSDNVVDGGIAVGEGNLATEWADNTEEFVSDTVDKTKAAGRWIGDRWEDTKGLASNAWEGTKNAGNAVGGWLGDRWEDTKGLASTAWGGLQSAGNSVKGAASDAWDSTKAAGSAARGLASDAWQGTKNAGSAVGGWFGDRWDDTTGYFSSITADREKMDIGSRPVGDGIHTPYTYDGASDGSVYSGFGGLGVHSGNSYSKFLYGDAEAGAIKQSDGSTKHGLSASVGVGKGEVDIIELINHFGGPGTISDKYVANLELGAGTAGVDSWFNPQKGASLGAQANFAEGAITAGTLGMSDSDRTGRFGLSAGAGLAGRLHWDDADNDGFREFGFGGDAGIFSVDYKTEDPLRDIGRSVVPGFQILEHTALPDTNLTHAAKDKVVGAASSAWNGTKNAAAGVASWGSQKASQAKKGVQGLAKSAGKKASSAKKYIGNKASQAKKGVQGLAKSAGKKATSAKKYVGKKASQAKKGVQGLAKSAGKKATSAKKYVGKKASQAKKGAKGLAKSARKKASSAKKYVGKKASQAKKSVKGLAKSAGKKATSAKKYVNKKKKQAKSVAKGLAKSTKKKASNAKKYVGKKANAAKKKVGSAWKKFKSKF